jgi:cation diffusion facilitator family transporter
MGFVHASGKDSDAGHHYGHGKFETFATFLICMTLLLVGAGIFWSGFRKMLNFFQGEILVQPSWIALGAALISLLVKEFLFRYTVSVGKRTRNQAVIANGWHHRSDSLSSIASALGIAGAILLGPRYSVLDPVAGMVVSLFIFKVSIKLGLPSINELLEASLPEETEKEISDTIMNTAGVCSFHRLKTRKIGNVYAIDVHIQLDRDISFIRSHDIATAIEIRLREKYGNQTQISIHTEPVKKLKE